MTLRWRASDRRGTTSPFETRDRRPRSASLSRRCSSRETYAVSRRDHRSGSAQDVGRGAGRTYLAQGETRWCSAVLHQAEQAAARTRFATAAISSVRPPWKRGRVLHVHALAARSDAPRLSRDAVQLVVSTNEGQFACGRTLVSRSWAGCPVLLSIHNAASSTLASCSSAFD